MTAAGGLERDLLFLAMAARGLPETVGPWVMLRPLGRGRSGPVFLAEERDSGRRAAVRLLSGAGAVEAITSARSHIGFAHPAAASVLATGENWIASEPTNGVPLSRILAAGRGDRVTEPLLRSLAAVGSAIDGLHGTNRFHGGISPGRIDVRRDGSLVIRDFGFDPSRAARPPTPEAPPLGSPHHMAPEQAGGPGEIGPATDVYSFASTVFSVAVGRPLYESRSLTGLLAAIREGRLPELPQDLAGVLRPALARDPTDRPDTLTDIVRAIGGE